jgi:hypothetical protein
MYANHGNRVNEQIMNNISQRPECTPAEVVEGCDGPSEGGGFVRLTFGLGLRPLVSAEGRVDSAEAKKDSRKGKDTDCLEAASDWAE